MPKLDLLNTRLDFGKASQSCVYNSLEDAATYSSLKKGMKGVPSASFTSTDSRMARCEKSSASGYVLPKCDRRGNKCDFADVLENGRKTVVFKTRETHFSDVDGNPIAEQFFKSAANRTRIEGQCMNRVLDNTHDVPAVTLFGSVEKGLVPGGYWDKSKKKDLYATTNSLGPGDYDVKYPSDKVNAVKFSQVETNRGFSGSSARRPSTVDSLPAQSPIKVPDDSSSILEEHTQGATFATSERFDPRCLEYRREFFVKTSGMKIGCDYDKHIVNKGRIPIKIDLRAPKFATNKADVVDVDVVPDCGNKKSLATAAKTTHVKFAAVFKSNQPIGTELPASAALKHVGPGYYKPQGLSAVEILDPIRQSSMFKSDRKFTSKTALPDSLSELPSFGDIHNRGISFMKQGTSKGNVHLQQWTKTKIEKIYPRLAKKKYGTPLPSEIAAMDRMATQGAVPVEEHDHLYGGAPTVPCTPSISRTSSVRSGMLSTAGSTVSLYELV